MKFDLNIEDFTIILNALHYYKKVEKRGNFQSYNEVRINAIKIFGTLLGVPGCELML